MDLPAFISPMLAMSAAEAFDDDRWIFELKWDGFRAIGRRDADGCQLIGRRKTDFTTRFSAISKVLERLPPGTIVDGELVALRPDGKPEFTSLLKGKRGKSNATGVSLAYVAFDLLYIDGKSVMRKPLIERRDRLRELIAAHPDKRLMMSEGVVGDGIAYFEQVTALALEGVMAKRLDSIYRPGARSEAWLKIKARQEVLAVVIGYETNPDGGLRSLVIAAATDGVLECVGQVGSGILPAMLKPLLAQLEPMVIKKPVVACTGIKAKWVEPKLMCKVSYAERLDTGKLRYPVFEGMVE